MEVVNLQPNPCYEEVGKADRASNLTTEIKYQDISGRSKKKWSMTQAMTTLTQLLFARVGVIPTTACVM